MSVSASVRRPVELLLLALVCGLRLWNLGGPGLWADEAYTAVISRQSISGIRAALREDDAPALFYLVEKGFVTLLGGSEWAVRLFPALCGCAAVFVSYGLLRRYAPRAAFAGLIVTGLSSLALFYSQQARSYSLLHLLTVLTIWALLRLRDRPTVARALALSALSLCLLYSHNLGLWTVAVAVTFGLVWLRASPRSVLALVATIAIGVIPWGIGVLQQLGRHQGANQWISTWWETRTLGLAPMYSTLVFLNGGASAVRPPVPMPILAERENSPISFAPELLLIALGLLAGIALIRAFRQGRHATEAEERQIQIAPILAMFTLAPLAGLLLTHLVIGPSYVVARTDTLALFPYLLLLAYGWSRTNRFVRTTALSIWILAFLLPLSPQLGRSAPKGSDRALAYWLAPRVQPGDALVVTPVGRPTLEYYGQRQGWLDRLGSLSTFPPIGDLNPAAAFPTPIDSLDAYRNQARAVRESWERAGVPTVWCEALMLERTAAHPQNPVAPPAERTRIDANKLAFPASLLVFTLIGLEPAEVSAEFRRDWMGGDRVLLAIPRSSWVPVDSLPTDVEIR